MAAKYANVNSQAATLGSFINSGNFKSSAAVPKVAQSIPTQKASINKLVATTPQAYSGNYAPVYTVKTIYNPVPTVGGVRTSQVASVPLVLAAANVSKTIETTGVKSASSQALSQGADVQKIAAAPKPSSQVVKSRIEEMPSGLKVISDAGMTSIVSDVTKAQSSVPEFYSDPNTVYNVTLGAKANIEQFLEGALSKEGQSLLRIMGALTGDKGVAGLRAEKNVGQMIEESLKEHSEYNFTDEQKEDLVKYYPDIALSLLSGQTKASDVKAFFDAKDAMLGSTAISPYVTYDAAGYEVLHDNKGLGSVGISMLDDEIRVSEFCARAKLAGASEETTQAIVADYMRSLDSESKQKMNEWVTSGGLRGATNIQLTVMDPGTNVGDWMKDDKNQLYMTAGTVLVGGVGGLALKGLAGMAGGAIMGVFAGTELPNLANTNVFAENTLQKLQAAGIKDAAATVGGYKTEYDNTTKAYNDALKRGDLVEANRQAYKMQQLSDRYANFVDENWAAYQKAGILEQTRQDVIAQYDTASKNRFEEGEPSKESASYDLMGFDPKQDWVKVNGIALTYFSGDSITLPPGEYKVEHGRTGYDPVVSYVTVSTKGGMTSGDASTLSAAKKASLDTLGSKVDAAKDPFTGKQRTTTAEKTMEFEEGVSYGIIWQKGWKVQDPYTLEWKESGDITVKGDGTTNVLFKDPQGNIRYTRVTTNDPFQSKFITGLDTLPFQPTQQQPYEPQKKTGEGYVYFGDDMMPGAKYYFDGVEVTERMAGTRVTPGDHSLIVVQDGYKPLEKTVSVNDGESNFLSLTHALVPEPVPYESSGGGGGGGGGGSSAPAAPQTMIMFGTSLAGCKLFLDGAEITPTLGTAYDTTPGYHAFKAQKAGMLDYDKNVYVSAGETLTVNAVFVAAPTTTPTDTTPTDTTKPPATPQTAKIVFGASVQGSQVYVDDGYVEIVIGTAYELPVGYHGVKISKSGMVDWLKTVYLAAGDTLTVSPVFEPLPVTPVYEDFTPEVTTKRVFINSDPTGAKILINDGFIGEWTPAFIDLERGLYKLTTQKSGLYDAQSWIYVGDVIAFGDTALALGQINNYEVSL